ncbi:MAG: DUF4332 domain-containing protein [Candidatus Thermoplasmatota archaeon]|nr:DUF4332 domain-containing protein [Candidatus Thermoplasmatota archaeon]
MDLTVIKGLGPARREKLEAAGVETIDALADADLDELAEDVGITETLLTDFQTQAEQLVRLRGIDGIGPVNLEKLVEADVRSVTQLSTVDLEDLNEATGIPVGQLNTWRRQARPLAVAEGAKSTVDKAKKAAQDTADKAAQQWKDARVVLREGINDARVKLEEEVIAEARILPLRAKDNVDKVLEQVKGNVIVLREKADTAIVRVEDELHEGIPLFKEKLDAAQSRAEQEAHEVRVRVQEIKDKRVVPKADALKEKVKSLFSRDK